MLTRRNCRWPLTIFGDILGAFGMMMFVAVLWGAAAVIAGHG